MPLTKSHHLSLFVPPYLPCCAFPRKLGEKCRGGFLEEIPGIRETRRSLAITRALPLTTEASLYFREHGQIFLTYQLRAGGSTERWGRGGEEGCREGCGRDAGVLAFLSTPSAERVRARVSVFPRPRFR